MKLTIKEIKLKDLEEYRLSEEYRSSSFVPISKLRTISHINNPRATKEDVCLFLAYDDNRFIGYLGALPDYIFLNSTKKKVYWLSCMWVLPGYRRYGIALELLKYAYNSFNGNVLITNFIPSSKKAFDKTGQYNELINLKGVRAYLRLDLANILTRKKPKLNRIKLLIKLIDSTANTLLNARLSIRSKSIKTSCEYSEIRSFDKTLSEYLNKKSSIGIFRRDAEQFSWMMKFPWVKKVNQFSKESARYYFSQESKDFQQWFIKVTNQGQVVGFILLNKNKGELKIPYLIFENQYVEDISKFILKLCIKERIRTYIGYNSPINNYLIKSKLFIITRPSSHGFLIGNKLSSDIEKPVILFEGDGDGGFI
jgi:GNAT superfamily N-acetyltransferase